MAVVCAKVNAALTRFRAHVVAPPESIALTLHDYVLISVELGHPELPISTINGCTVHLHDDVDADVFVTGGATVMRYYAHGGALFAGRYLRR